MQVGKSIFWYTYQPTCCLQSLPFCFIPIFLFITYLLSSYCLDITYFLTKVSNSVSIIHISFQMTQFIFLMTYNTKLENWFVEGSSFQERNNRYKGYLHYNLTIKVGCLSVLIGLPSPPTTTLLIGAIELSYRDNFLASTTYFRLIQ